MSSIAAIIPAAGSGTRMGQPQPKQFLALAGLPLLVHTVRAFLQVRRIKRIVVVVPSDWLAPTRELLAAHLPATPSLTITAGGRRRQDSVQAGLRCLDDDTDLVLVHDGARPLVSPALIRRLCEDAAAFGAAIAAVPVKDTLKRATADQQIAQTLDRTDLWQAQTPQAARRSLLNAAYEAAGVQDFTDEASLLEAIGVPVHLSTGEETNLKITRPDDLALAEKIMTLSHPSLRVGHGYDAHCFAPERDLVLGGVKIPHELGLAGHSDADVLTHALCDAILGAMGKGDIGRHFPDSDPHFKNIFSISLLGKVIHLAEEQGLALVNADVTVICQAPKLAPYMEGMRRTLAAACKVEMEQINIKATTTEKMGFTGRMEGIACHAVVLLSSR